MIVSRDLHTTSEVLVLSGGEMGSVFTTMDSELEACQAGCHRHPYPQRGTHLLHELQARRKECRFLSSLWLLPFHGIARAFLVRCRVLDEAVGGQDHEGLLLGRTTAHDEAKRTQLATTTKP